MLTADITPILARAPVTRIIGVCPIRAQHVRASFQECNSLPCSNVLLLKFILGFFDWPKLPAPLGFPLSAPMDFPSEGTRE